MSCELRSPITPAIVRQHIDFQQSADVRNRLSLAQLQFSSAQLGNNLVGGIWPIHTINTPSKVLSADISNTTCHRIGSFELDRVMQWKQISLATVIAVSGCFSGILTAFETSEILRRPHSISDSRSEAQPPTFGNVSTLPNQHSLYRNPLKKNTSHKASKFRDAGYFLETEYLNWQIRRSDLDYAISGNLNLDGGIDNASLHGVTHQSEPGFRLLFGRSINDDWNIAFGLTTYSANQDATVVAGSGLVYATLTNPFEFDTQIGRADASSNFEQRVYDLYISRQVDVGGKRNVKIFGSMRFTDHDSTKRVDYFDIDEISPLSNIASETNSTGFGIRIGGEGIWEITDRSYAFAAGESSLLLNRVTTTTVNTRTPSVGGNVVNSVFDEYTQPLSVLGATVGLGHKFGTIDIRLGYEINSWFNLGARTAITNDASASFYSYNREESDIIVDGIFLRCNWEF